MYCYIPTFHPQALPQKCNKECEKIKKTQFFFFFFFGGANEVLLFFYISYSTIHNFENNVVYLLIPHLFLHFLFIYLFLHFDDVTLMSLEILVFKILHSLQMAMLNFFN